MSEFSNHKQNNQSAMTADVMLLMLSAKTLSLASDVLATIAADPAGLMTPAKAAGLNASYFEDDLLCIYVAMNHTFTRGRDKVFAATCAKFLLQRGGWWTDRDDYAGGLEWSAKRLGSFFYSWFPCPSIVEHHVCQLVALNDRMHEIGGHLGAVRELLKARPDDVKWIRETGLFDDVPTTTGIPALLGKAVAA